MKAFQNVLREHFSKCGLDSHLALLFKSRQRISKCKLQLWSGQKGHYKYLEFEIIYNIYNVLPPYVI